MTLRTLVLFVALPFSAVASQALAQTPSALVQPALDKLAQTGSGVDLNRWKGGNALRSDVDAHLASIQKDLQSTLPPLLAASDKSPASVSASLPVLLNLDALYSVVLRVNLLAKASAPRDEAEALDGALAALDGARRDLGDRIVASAATQEKQIGELQAANQQAARISAAQQAAAPAQSEPASKPVKKRVLKKPAAAPAPAVTK